MSDAKLFRAQLSNVLRDIGDAITDGKGFMSDEQAMRLRRAENLVEDLVEDLESEAGDEVDK